MIGYFVREWWKNKIIEQRSYNKHELCCCIKSSFACSNIREQPLSIRQAVRICSETWLNNTIILPSLFYDVNNAVARAIELVSAIWHNFQIWRGLSSDVIAHLLYFHDKNATYPHTSLNRSCSITWQRIFLFWMFSACTTSRWKSENVPLQNRPPFWKLLSTSFPGSSSFSLIALGVKLRQEIAPMRLQHLSLITEGVYN